MGEEATQYLTLRRGDDWHLHLREGAMLAAVLPYSARQFARAIAMPNLDVPVTTCARARAYREQIRAARPAGSEFEPLMTCYLTDESDPDDIAAGHAEGLLTAAKLYPANATTNSAQGVSAISKLWGVFERMQAIDMPLLIHGEVTDSAVDVFDREAMFIEHHLAPLTRDFPALRIVFEHITTSEAVAFVDAASTKVAATITAHHLHIDRNAMFAGGLRPHAYCLPVAKRATHRRALRRAATSGSAKYFLGTDSAPHRREDKESACGCAGIFSAAFALESYAQTFEEEGALDKLEAFSANNGADFYDLPRNAETIRLQRSAHKVPEFIDTPLGKIVPFRAGETLPWRLVEE